MRPLVLAALLALAPLALSSAAWADLPEAPFAQCRAAIAAAERSSSVPDRLMQSIGIMESGRRDGAGAASAWPWTINHEGIGAFFATKAEAVAAVAALQSQGVRSIDVGCMQVNLMHHGSAFSSLEEAFDPGANARYAGQFLNQLLARTGSWPGATAGYHSLTPDIGADYARKVLAIWARPAGRQPPVAEAPTQQAKLQPWVPPSPVPPASTTLAFASNARIIPLPSSVPGSPGALVGRGLAAYRAMPTQLAARVMPGRPNPTS